MSVFKKLSRIDRAILLGAIFALLMLSYLLYDDSILFEKISRNDKPIGTILKAQNDVRRKSSNNFVWLPGTQKDELYNRDSIFTGDQSQATITLNDGSLIQIQENSLVNLNMLNGEMQLDLHFGQFSGNVTPLRLKSCNEEYVIDGANSKFEINRSENCGLDVKVISGDVQIKSKKGNQAVKQNESLKISKSGAEKSTVESSIRLITKNDVYQYREKDKQPIFFEWKGQGSLSKFQIEISKTAEFNKILTTKSTHEEKVGLKDSLREGSYFWRVRGLNNRHKIVASSPVQKFYLSYLPAPGILAPLHNAKVKSKIINTKEALVAPIKVSWTSSPNLTQYEWQLSNQEDFNNVLESKTLTNGEVTSTPLIPGIYFTRVRGLDKNNRPSPWSKAHSFDFSIEGEPKPPAPRLTEKRIRFLVPSEKDRKPSSAKSPQMGWTDVDVAKNYRWEISSSPKFASTQFMDTEDTRIAWHTYKPGKHYFRVFSRTELGQMSPPSETGVLEVFGENPILEPIPSILVKETNTEATPPTREAHAKWSPLANAKSYLIQVDKTPDFLNPAQFEVSENKGSIPLSAPGKYFVRIKGQGEEATDVSDFSNIESVDYIFRLTLKAPELLEPFDKTTVFLQKDMEPLIWLEWSPVRDAENYRLEASTTPDYSKIVISKDLKQTRLLIQQKIPYGIIYWRVKTVSKDEEMNSEWSERQFNLYHQRNRGF